MTGLRDALGVVLLICVAVRVGAWLLEPAIPLLVVLFALAALFTVMLGRDRRW